MVVDVGCVVPGDGNTSEQTVEQPRARLGELVQGEAATRELGMDGEEPGPGRGFEHEVGGCDRRRSARGEAELDRGGELLERLALLRAAGVGRKQHRQLGKHGEECRW